MKILLNYTITILINFSIMAQNAVLVKDIKSVASNLQNTLTSDPQFLTSFKGNLYFAATDDTHGRELWKTDGTTAGTIMVMDINNIGDGSSSPANLTVIGNYLYFSANDGTFGAELWKSDGTAAGTNMLKNINNAANGLGSSLPNHIISIDQTNFYFFADDGIHGNELWKSNGTTNGTILVQDFTVNGHFSVTETIIIGNVLYFGAFINVLSTGSNLYSTDGNTINKIYPSNNCTLGSDLYPIGLTNVNGNLFFAGQGFCNGVTTGEELWIKRPNFGNAELVKDITISTAEAYTRDLVNYNNTLYFTTGIYPNLVLWKSDGSTDGTMIVKNVITNGPLTFNGKMYFNGFAPGYDFELWQSDGTTNGTNMLKDINPNSGQGWPELFKVVGNTLYFRAKNTSGSNAWELWKTDGTEAGTVQVQDIFPGVDGSMPQDLTEVDGILYFSANDGVHGRELWRTTQPTCSSNAIPTLIYPNNLATVTLPIQNEYYYGNISCNQLIARIRPAGVTKPASGNITAKVWGYNIGIPTDIVLRHYEIAPLTNATQASARITLYFDRDEFDDYNQNYPGYTDFGDGPLPYDSNDPQDNIKNLRIIKYNGISSDGTGFPSTYASLPTVIDPADSDIIYNSLDQRWEVTFNTTGAGGYFVQSADKIVCNEVNKLYSTQDGNWNNPDTWSCKRIPLATDEVTIKALQKITVPASYLGVAKKTIIETDALLDIKAGGKVSH